LAVVVIGCRGSDETGQGPATDEGADGPDAAIFEFLEAVRTGNDEKAAMMLTSTAREKTAQLNMEVAPPGSDTATFEVGEVKYLPGHRAQVACTWSDLDANSKERRTDEILWIVRHEPEGWRIGGVAATIFQGEPPLLLNFEDPEEMFKKQQWIQQEIRRRAQQANSQAEKPENADNSTRR
jgi:hypothetical protein